MWNQSISAHNCHRNCARLVGSNLNKMPIRYGFRGSPISIWYGVNMVSSIFSRTTEIFTVAHNCHGKLKFTTASSNSRRQIQIRWPTTVTANKIYHGKFKFAMANSNSRWKIKIYHGKSTRWSRGKMGVLNNARVGKDRRATARVGFCRHPFLWTVKYLL